MTQRKNSTTTDADVDIQTAAALVLQREEQRKTQRKDSVRKQHGKRQQKQLAAIQQLLRSLEFIKWVSIALAVVVFVGLVFISWTLTETRQDIAEIKQKLSQTQADLAKLESEVGDVTDSLQRPLETLLKKVGERLDAQLPSLDEGNEDSPE